MPNQMRPTGRTRHLRVVEAERSELVCPSCGYRVSVARPPARCPMCQHTRWQPRGPAAALSLRREPGTWSA